MMRSVTNTSTRRAPRLTALVALFVVTGWAGSSCRVRLIDPTPPSDESDTDDEAPTVDVWAHDLTPFPFRMPAQLPRLRYVDAGSPARGGPGPLPALDVDSRQSDEDGGSVALRRAPAAGSTRRKPSSTTPSATVSQTPSLVSSTTSGAPASPASSTSSAALPSVAPGDPP